MLLVELVIIAEICVALFVVFLVFGCVYHVLRQLRQDQQQRQLWKSHKGLAASNKKKE